MVTLADLFDIDLLDRRIADGHVNVRTHPAEGVNLHIYNYSKSASYDRVWDDVTEQCRGLVADRDGNVIARPFRKFYNYGEPTAPDMPLDAPVVTLDKLDGSMGVLVPLGDGTHHVATRGSFDSDQSRHATELWNSRYHGNVTVADGFTALFEIIYPENRIVLNYGDMDDLVLLAVIDNETGRAVRDMSTVVDGWDGPVVREFDHATFADAIAAPPRDNAEGMVVWFPDTDDRVKLKQEDYIELHRVVTNITARSVWGYLTDTDDGTDISELFGSLPDEFHPWVRNVVNHLETYVTDEQVRLASLYDTVTSDLPESWERKDFARKVMTEHRDDAGYLFALLDGKDIVPDLWDDAKPEGELTPATWKFE